jgi:hypothetical protein
MTVQKAQTGCGIKDWYDQLILHGLTVHYRQIPCIVIMRQFEGGGGERRRKGRRNNFRMDMLVRTIDDCVPFQMNQHVGL